MSNPYEDVDTTQTSQDQRPASGANVGGYDAAQDVPVKPISPITAYSDLDPEEILTVAATFVERFRAIDDPQAQKYARLNPSAVLPSQLHEMHRYAEANHPEVLIGILQQPNVSGTLGSFADFESARLSDTDTPQPES